MIAVDVLKILFLLKFHRNLRKAQMSTFLYSMEDRVRMASAVESIDYRRDTLESNSIVMKQLLSFPPVVAINSALSFLSVLP